MNQSEDSPNDLGNRYLEACHEIVKLKKELADHFPQNPIVNPDLQNFVTENEAHFIIILSSEFKIIEASAYANTITFRDTGKPLLPGRSIFDVFPDDQLENLRRLLDAAASGKTVSVDLPSSNPEDGLHWLRYQFRPARKTGEQPTEVIIHASDITDQKLAQLAHLESEERFRRVFEFSPQGLLILRLEDGQVIECNQKFCALTGKKTKEVTGKPLIEANLFIHSDQQNACLQKLKQTRSFHNYPAEIKANSGQIIPCLLSSTMIILGGVEHSLLSFQNIEDFKKSQDALRSCRSRFKLVSDNTDDLFITLDDQIEISTWNRAAELFTGVPAAVAEKKPLADILPKLCDQLDFQNIRQVLDTKKPLHSVVNWDTGDGHYLIEVHIHPYVQGLILHCKDITQTHQISQREKQLTLDQELLTDFAMEFERLPLDEDIYPLLCGHIRQLTGCAVAAACVYDENKKQWIYRAISFSEALQNPLLTKQDLPEPGTGILLDEESQANLRQGSIFELRRDPPQMFQWLREDWPHPAGQSIEGARVYAGGLGSDSQLLGGIWLFFSKEDPFDRQESAGVYLRIASNALRQRIYLTNLKDSETRSLRMIEDASVGILLVNLQGKITVWNQSLEKIIGIPAKDVIGKPIWPVLHKIKPGEKSVFGLSDPDLEDGSAGVNALPSPRYYSFEELEIATPSGRSKNIQAMIFPVAQAGGDEIGAILQDVTSDRRRQQEMESIIAFNQALRPITTAGEMIPIVGKNLMSLLNLEGVVITLYNPQMDNNRLEFGDGCWKDLPATSVTRMEELSSQVLRTGGVHIANHFAEENREIATNHRFSPPMAAACIPLATPGQILGTVWVGAGVPIQEEDLRVVKIICEITAAAMNRSALYEQLQRRLDHISALRLIDRTIAGNLDLRIGMHVLLDQVVAQLKVDAAAIHLINRHTENLEFGEGRGFRSSLIKQTHLSIAEGLAGRAVIERNILFIPDLRNSPEKFTRKDLRIQEDFISYCVAPLIVKGEVNGVMELFMRSPLTPSTEWLEFFENLAGQAAIMIDNSELYNRLQQSNLELRLAYNHTLEGWVRALDLRDKETEGHTQRVTDMTLRLAMAMGIPNDRLVHIQRGALLHDIGKMAISDDVLRKPGELTPEERKIMQQHPQVAYDLLHPITFLQEALDIPYCHHEQWDGKGYPRGLKKEEIPIAARIFSVVDVWDALSSDRHYRKAWSKEQARIYIKSNSGILFDPAVVHAFLEMTERDGVNP